MSTLPVGYSDLANHLMKSGSLAGFTDLANHKLNFIEIGGADGANHKAWSSLSVGDTYVLGGRNWTVVNINTSGQATLLCQTIYSVDAANTYEWDTGGFRIDCVIMYNAFAAADKAKIVTVANKSGTSSIVSIDNVWLLSVSQIFGTSKMYGAHAVPSEGEQLAWFLSHNTNAERASLFGNGMSATRSTHVYNATFPVYVVRASGDLDIESVTLTSLEIRPAILINP